MSKKINIVNKETNYCRRCQKDLPVKNFYSAVDPLLDRNGYMSVCKTCIEDIYSRYYTSEKNVDKAIHATCQTIDIAYLPDAISLTHSRLADNPGRPVMGMYKQSLSAITVKDESKDGSLTYRGSYAMEVDRIEKDIEFIEENEDIISVWGAGFEPEDYKFLNDTYKRYAHDYSTVNEAERSLLRSIVHTELRLRKAQQTGSGSIKTEIGLLQSLLKTAAIDPAKANVAGADKDVQAYGVWVKDIEQRTPAEWLDEIDPDTKRPKRDAFQDVDNLDKYFSDYTYRAVQNFFTGSRDFSMLEDGDNLYEDDVEELEG